MKRKMLVVLLMSLLLTVSVSVFPVSTVHATEQDSLPEYFYGLDDWQDTWVGENVALDILEYDTIEWVTSLRLYSAAWASRYGGASLMGKALNMPVSAQKNRYMVINVMPDSIATWNEFDKFLGIYWKTNDTTVYFQENVPTAFSVLHDAEPDVYHKIIVDLAWEEEFIVDVLRLDMFSTPEGAADSTDGYNCGNLFIEYIAFFDTYEQASAFTYSMTEDATTNPPVDTTPTEEVSNTPEATTQITEPTTTQTPDVLPTQDVDADTPSQDVEKSPVVGIIIGIVVALAVAVVVIVFITKPKKK